MLAAGVAALAVASFAVGDIGRDGRLILGGDTYLSGGRLKHVTIWDLATSRVVRKLHQDVGAPVFSPDGRFVVGEGRENTAIIFDSRSGRPLRTLHGRVGYLMRPAFSPDGDVVVALDGEPAVMEETDVGVWSAAGGQRLRTFRCSSEAYSGHCFNVEFSPDGRRILAAGFDAKARLWDLRSGRQLRVFAPAAAFGEGSDQAETDASFSPDGKLVVVTADSEVASSVSLFDIGSGRTRLVLHRATDPAFSPDGRLLATHEGGRTIRIHDARSGRLVKSLQDPRGAAGALMFSGDGSRLISYAGAFHSSLYGRSFTALRIWNLAHQTVQYTVRTRFYAIEKSMKGNLLITIGPSIQVWNVATGRLSSTLHR